MNNERFQCPEALFQPLLVDGKDVPGIHDVVYQQL